MAGDLEMGSMVDLNIHWDGGVGGCNRVLCVSFWPCTTNMEIDVLGGYIFWILVDFVRFVA